MKPTLALFASLAVCSLAAGGCGSRQQNYKEGTSAPTVSKDGVTASLMAFKESKGEIVARILLRNDSSTGFILTCPKGKMESLQATAEGQTVFGKPSANDIKADSGDAIGLGTLRDLHVLGQLQSQQKFTVPAGGHQKFDVKFDLDHKLSSSDVPFTVIITGYRESVDPQHATTISLQAP